MKTQLAKIMESQCLQKKVKNIPPTSLPPSAPLFPSPSSILPPELAFITSHCLQNKLKTHGVKTCHSPVSLGLSSPQKLQLPLAVLREQLPYPQFYAFDRVSLSLFGVISSPLSNHKPTHPFRPRFYVTSSPVSIPNFLPSLWQNQSLLARFQNHFIHISDMSY